MITSLPRVSSCFYHQLQIQFSADERYIFFFPSSLSASIRESKMELSYHANCLLLRDNSTYNLIISDFRRSRWRYHQTYLLLFSAQMPRQSFHRGVIVQQIALLDISAVSLYCYCKKNVHFVFNLIHRLSHNLLIYIITCEGLMQPHGVNLLESSQASISVTFDFYLNNSYIRSLSFIWIFSVI